MQGKSEIGNLQSAIKIVFMGTPEFAVASLEALLRSGYNIVGVITTPDKPAGRGMKMQESAVKKYAKGHGLNILQPSKLKSPEFLEELKAMKADLQVVVAFRMLPEQVWNMPPMGTINLHASLLPQYRGAAPINWAIINGEKETGLTTFKLKHEIDTGDILLQEKLLIGENETAGELHDRMKELGGHLLTQTVEGLINKSLKEKPQQPAVNSYQPELRTAPKISTETCRINWEKPVEDIHNLIRGLSPYPAAFTELDGKMLKVFKSEKEFSSHGLQPGETATDHKFFLKYACKDGFILLKEIQLAGKKRMPIGEFLRGFHLSKD